MGVACMVLQAYDGAAWQGLPLARAGLGNEYCEYNHMAAFVRQPMNAWSNFCYCFIGIWMVGWAVRDMREPSAPSPQRRFPAMTLWLGLLLIGLCFGSFFFHASLTRIGQHWDMAFTYAVSLGLACAAAYRAAIMVGMKETFLAKAAWLALAVALAVLWYGIKWRVDGRMALPAMMLVGIVLLLTVYLRHRRRYSAGWLLAGLFALALAALFRILDLDKVGCSPQGWFQLHALWHVCTGSAAFFFLAFLRGEKP